MYCKYCGKEIADDAKKPIDSAQIIEKVSELGETSFALSNCKVNYDGTSFFSFSELKELRRQCSDELAEDLVNSYRRHAPAKVNKVFNETDKYIDLTDDLHYSEYNEVGVKFNQQLKAYAQLFSNRSYFES